MTIINQETGRFSRDLFQNVRNFPDVIKQLKQLFFMSFFTVASWNEIIEFAAAKIVHSALQSQIPDEINFGACKSAKKEYFNQRDFTLIFQ